ncbi:hypothetical protein LINGRAHAP2_LOCUS17602 [Linum grandiflorum]
MHSLSKLAILFFVTGLITVVIVDGKLPSTKVVVKPGCGAKSTSKRFDKYAGHLLDFLVDETKNVYKNTDGSYTYSHGYPDMDSGSANGVGTCGRELKKLDCWSCLRTAKDKVKSACHGADGGNVTLKDCSISFSLIP